MQLLKPLLSPYQGFGKTLLLTIILFVALVMQMAGSTLSLFGSTFAIPQSAGYAMYGLGVLIFILFIGAVLSRAQSSAQEHGEWPSLFKHALLLGLEGFAVILVFMLPYIFSRYIPGTFGRVTVNVMFLALLYIVPGSLAQLSATSLAGAFRFKQLFAKLFSLAYLKAWIVSAVTLVIYSAIGWGLAVGLQYIPNVVAAQLGTTVSWALIGSIALLSLAGMLGYVWSDDYGQENRPAPSRS